jgi:hypothetical protein
MKLKSIISFIIIFLIVCGVGLYLFALDNRYKQIYGRDYFDLRTGRMVKASSAGQGEVIVEYPLLKSQYQIGDDPGDKPSE